MENTLTQEQQKSVNYWQLAKHALILVLGIVAVLALIWYFPEEMLVFQRPWLGWIAIVLAFIFTCRSLVIILRMLLLFTDAPKQRNILLVVIVLSLLIAIAGVYALVHLDPFYQETRARILTAPGTHLSLNSEAINISSFEQLLEQEINQVRISYNLPALQHDPLLATIALSHSKEMAENQYLEHINILGDDAIARGNKAGYPCTKDYGVINKNRIRSAGIGENLARIPLGNIVGCGKVYSEKALASCTVEGWMNSSEHRTNILTNTYDKEGIGIFRFKNDFYITQNFC